MKRIVFTRPDGGLSIVTPVINTRGDEGMTEDQALLRAVESLPADAIRPRVIEASELPQDRSTRDRWTDTGTAIVVR
jgi:hypothetical protein